MILGFGCMRLPLLDEGDQKSIDIKQLEEMEDRFIEKGFTYFDTAYMYHKFTSEETMGKTLVSRYNRNDFTITSKMPLMFLKEEADLDRIFNEQLEKLKIDYFDYYLLHNITRDRIKKVEELDVFGYVENKLKEGKVKSWGFSFHDDAQLLDEVLSNHPQVDFVQLQLNYLDWDNPIIQSKKCYEVAVKHGKKVFVMEPIKGGSLVSLPKEARDVLEKVRPERSLAQWALGFVASLPNVEKVLSGMSSLKQLEENTDYFLDFTPFEDEDFKAIEEVQKIMAKTKDIQCTACRYCVDGCPKQIPIPDYFTLYNAHNQSENNLFSTHQMYYENLLKDYSPASKCIKCGKCERSCPQHLPIVEDLKRVAEVFEN